MIFLGYPTKIHFLKNSSMISFQVDVYLAVSGIVEKLYLNQNYIVQ